MVLRLRKLLCMLLVVCLLTPAALASGISAKINANSVRVYKTASTSSKSAKLSKGTTVTIKSISGNWAKIAKNGKTAYVNVKYLTTTSKYARYTNKKVGLYRRATTGSTCKAMLPVNTKVYVIGLEDGFYRVQNASGSITGYIAMSALSKRKVATSNTTGSSSSRSSTSWKSKVKKVSWDYGSTLFPKGKYATIYDIDTGISVRIKRMGGVNHADVEPASKSDTEKLRKIAGGTFSWKSHAVILIVGGNYIACGINTMPHGDQTLSNNNYDGQFCLHMSDSTTHCSGKSNEDHQSSIRRAYNWAH